ncbi:RidA family protein [Planosporangium thailandense]|uniref:RidA family protein n=1 Tax=Planosporangium thailandense TaxID=765197 RepID=A0ABX0XUX0_9ACTN|nr:RidA family protein [Planosporangium thailandense]
MISRLGSGGPWEETIGYSRVVQAGPLVLTAGCTATVDGVVKHTGDAYAQTLLAVEIALEAAGQFGVTAEDVVRTRMYVVGVENGDAVGRAHGAVFRDIRPVATMVFVDRLIDPEMLVEVEVEAYKP